VSKNALKLTFDGFSTDKFLKEGPGQRLLYPKIMEFLLSEFYGIPDWTQKLIYGISQYRKI
jgi:hypothetical protein